jgi:DNA replication protein DnaC
LKRSDENLAREREAQRNHERRKMWGASGASPRHDRCDYERPDLVPADIREEYVKTCKKLEGMIHNPVIVALLAPRGVGKTGIAHGLMRQFIRADRSALYVNSPMKIFRDLKASYRENATNDEEAVLRRYSSPSLLVIDEFHEFGGTDFERRTMTELLDIRYLKLRSTLLLANEEPAAMRERLGTSIASRMDDFGGFVVCKWRPIRGEIDPFASPADLAPEQKE